VFLWAGAGQAADWPGWRGAKRDAVSAEQGLLQEWPAAGPALAWKATGVGAGLSGVAVAGERLYTIGDEGDAQYLIALDRTNGRLAWKTRLGPAWKDEFAGARSTPTVDGALVFALGTEGDLVCAEAATGRVVWQKNLEKEYGGRVMTIWKWSESPLVDGDLLVFTPGGPWAAMVAVQKATGQKVWETEEMPNLGPKGRDGAGYSSIVVSNGAGVKQYVQLMGKGLVGIRASDGKFLWGYNRVANNVANISTPIVRGDYVFASTGYQTGSALLKLEKDGDGVKASEVYFLEPGTLQNHHGGLVLVGDHVYAGHGHNKGFPICVDFATGKVTWGGDIRNAGTGSAAVMYADGRLYYRYQNGVVILVEASPAGYKERGSFTIPDATQPSWPHLTVADGKLYVREQDAVYCYDVRRGKGSAAGAP
jgi:outer membrane protein assembly factor BamB